MNNKSSAFDNLNNLAAAVHLANRKWWQDIHTGQPIRRNPGQLLMMVVTELAEGVEGIRKNLMDDKLPHRRMEEVELADGWIRLLDFAGGFGLNLTALPYNEVRLSDDKAEAMLELTSAVVQIRKARWHFAMENRMSEALALFRAYAAQFNLDLEGAYAEKMEFNARRADHTHAARAEANGKKF